MARRREVPKSRPVVVDAVRTADQVALLRREVVVCHVHLTASQALLEERYEKRRKAFRDFELPSFEALRMSATEAESDALGGLADVVVDTGQLTIAQTRDAVARFLRDRKMA
jgi:hypothetical protein